MEPAARIRSIQSEYFRMLEGHLPEVWAPFARRGTRLGSFRPREGAHPPRDVRALPPTRAPVDYTDRVRPLLADVRAFWAQHASGLYAAVRALPVAKLQIGDVSVDPWDYEGVLLRFGLSFDTVLAFDPLDAMAEPPGEGAPERRYLGGDSDTDRILHGYLLSRRIAQVALADTELPVLVLLPYPPPAVAKASLDEWDFERLCLQIFTDVFSPGAPLVDLDDWSRLALRLGSSRLVRMLQAAPQFSGYFDGERPHLGSVLGSHHEEQRAGGLHLPEDVFVPLALMVHLTPPFLQLSMRETFAVQQGAAVLVPSSHWALDRYRLEIEPIVKRRESAGGFVTSTPLTWLGARTLEDLVALRRSDRLEDVRQLTRSLLDRSRGDRSAREMDDELRRLASTLADRVGTAARPAGPRDGPTFDAHPATFAAACSSWCTPSPGGDRPPRPLALLDAVRDA